MEGNEELLGATAVPSDPGPPAWLKRLLDHQAQQFQHQAQQFQQLLTPTLQNVTAEQRVTTRALPTVPTPPPSTFQETQEQPRVQTDAPFAAELEVIRQRSHNAGPYNTSNIHDPAVRRRDERMPQRSAPAHMASQEAYSMYGNSGNRHNMGRQLPHEASKVKLATYDGKEDWDSFLLPFEHLACKYGWTGAERIDRLHECLCGVAIRYVCSLLEHIR